MKINKVNEKISVAPQITANDVSEIAQLGYKSLICNRPDGEEPSQPLYSDIKAQAQEHGLDIVHIPVQGSDITEADINEFKESLDSLPGPLLAYCRTGTRSIILWSLSNPDSLSVDEIIRKAASAGYDLSALVERLDSR